MHLITALVLALLTFAIPAEAATYSTVSNGVALTLNITPQAITKPSGTTTILVDGTWSYTKGSLSFSNGVIYPSYWTDYKNGTSAMFENNMTRGAEVLFMFAPPSSSCTAGALIQAILEMPNAASFTNAGNQITLTPVSGFICGETISSFTVYSLGLGAPTTTATTTTTTTTTSTTGTTSATLPFSGNWSGSWSSVKNRGAGGAISATIVQAGVTQGSTITGNVLLAGSTCFSNTIAMIGTLSGSGLDALINGGGVSLNINLATKASPTMSGNYTVTAGVCAGDFGSFSLSKQ